MKLKSLQWQNKWPIKSCVNKQYLDRELEYQM